LKKATARNVALELVLLERESRIFLIQRSCTERRLADFWELPGKKLFPHLSGTKLNEFRHQIVNDRFRVTVWQVPPVKLRQFVLPSGSWFEPAELGRIPLTTVTKKALSRILESEEG
jgi:hypothetical protein